MIDMAAKQQQKRLLAVIELGGYPNFSALYSRLGYEMVSVTSVRHAIRYMKSETPELIVAEFNFQSDFRDRTSSLESLFAVVQRLTNTRVIVFYDKEFAHQFEKLRANYPVYAALEFPIDEKRLAQVVEEAG